jgi:hypothetical protein
MRCPNRRSPRRYPGAAIWLLLSCVAGSALAEPPAEPRQVFDWVTKLEGQWTLSAAETQEGGTHLRAVYSTFLNGEHAPDTVFNFDWIAGPE